MKLSVEGKVAAAVAAGFIGLTAAAIGQRGSDVQSAGSGNYGPIENRRGNKHIRVQPYNNLLSDRTNVEKNGQTLSIQDGPITSSRKSTKGKTEKSHQHHVSAPS